MNKKEIAPHVEDITRALNGKLSKQEVEEQLQMYLEDYGVPLAEAKRAIVNKHEGNPGDLYTKVEKKIDDITGDERSLYFKARIVSLNEKEITANDEPKTIFYGIFGDDTGTIPFTIWDKSIMPSELSESDTVKISNSYANVWNDKPQVNVGERASIEIIDENEVPQFSSESIACNTKDIREGMSNLHVTGRVLSVEKKTVQTNSGEKDLFSGIIADESGKVQFSAWHDFDIKVDDVLKVKGGYVRSWRGIPQFNFGEDASVEKLSGDEMPSLDELKDVGCMTISELARRGGAVETIVDAVVIDVKAGSGLIFRCPECNRVVQSGSCRVHGRVEGEPDLRVKGILDDGTGALTVIINRELTEDILGYDLDKAIEKAKDRMDHGVIKDEIEDMLIAQPLRVKGNVTSDDYGLMMVASEIQQRSIDVKKEIKNLLDEVAI